MSILLYESYGPVREWGRRIVGIKREAIGEDAECEHGEIYEVQTEYSFLPGIPPVTEWALMQSIRFWDWRKKGVELTYIRVEATWLKAKTLVQFRVLSSFSPVPLPLIIGAIAVIATAIGLAIVAYYAYHIVRRVAPPPEVSKYVWVAIGVSLPIVAVGYLLKRGRRERY